MFTGNENHEITLAEAAQLTLNFRNAQTTNDYIKAEFFGRDAIENVLADSAALGIRIYYGLDSNNIPRQVIVGVNADGNDLVNGILLEKGVQCPPACSAITDLNG